MSNLSILVIHLIGHPIVQMLNVVWDYTFYYYVNSISSLSEQLEHVEPKYLLPVQETGSQDQIRLNLNL